jgi:hypothetical protein
MTSRSERAGLRLFVGLVIFFCLFFVMLLPSTRYLFGRHEGVEYYLAVASVYFVFFALAYWQVPWLRSRVGNNVLEFLAVLGILVGLIATVVPDQRKYEEERRKGAQEVSGELMLLVFDKASEIEAMLACSEWNGYKWKLDQTRPDIAPKDRDDFLLNKDTDANRLCANLYGIRRIDGETREQVFGMLAVVEKLAPPNVIPSEDFASLRRWLGQAFSYEEQYDRNEAEKYRLIDEAMRHLAPLFVAISCGFGLGRSFWRLSGRLEDE